MSCYSKEFMQYKSQNTRKNAGRDLFPILFSFMTLGARTEWKNFLKMSNKTTPGHLVWKGMFGNASRYILKETKAALTFLRGVKTPTSAISVRVLRQAKSSDPRP